MADLTRILSQIEQGDPSAAEQLLPLVYDELHKLAAAKLRAEKPNQTLQATALVHEAYLRLVDQAHPQTWDGRGHFFAAAAEAMRRILINRARDKQRLKRGGDRQRLDLDQVVLATTTPAEELLAVDEAIERLEDVDDLAAKVIRLKFFAGLTLEETAAALRVSRRTVDRHWAYGRAWLLSELGNQETPASNSRN